MEEAPSSTHRFVGVRDVPAGVARQLAKEVLRTHGDRVSPCSTGAWASCLLAVYWPESGYSNVEVYASVAVACRPISGMGCIRRELGRNE